LCMGIFSLAATTSIGPAQEPRPTSSTPIIKIA
jgi:hypothetical protein